MKTDKNRNKRERFSKEGTTMRWSDERHQSTERASLVHSPSQSNIQMHWTAAVSVALGLLDVILVGCLVLFNTTEVGLSAWWHVTPTLWSEWEPIISAVFIGGAVYSLVGWIFGLIAFHVAWKPAWRRGFALAAWGLGFHLVSFVVVVGSFFVLLSLLSHVR
jgi:hypothetical protein